MDVPFRILRAAAQTNTLDYAARRISRYAPETYLRNVLAPIPFESEYFDSIGLGYLLHCIPGTLESKAVVFVHLATLLKSGGVLFGATLLHEGVERRWRARNLMAFYNRKGIFCNRDDSLTGLTHALEKRFDDVIVEVIGCAALFSVRVT